MKKIKLNKIAAVIILLSVISFAGLKSVSAGINTVRDLTGKVVYQNDKSPVSGGTIDVFLYSDDDESGKLIESVSINSAGEFTLTNVAGNQADGVKIMCYPNDIQDSHVGFSAKEVRLSDVNKVNDKGYDIIIEVRKVDLK